jgi:hypothetical protein
LKRGKFLQTNGHDQPGLSALTGDNDVTDRRGSYPGRGEPDHLWIVRPAHELRNEIVEEFIADRVSERCAEQEALFVRSGRIRGMESEKGRR